MKIKKPFKKPLKKYFKKPLKKYFKKPLKKYLKKHLKKHVDKYSERKNLCLIEGSIFFNSSWYRNQYSDIGDNEDLAKHYFLYGWKEGKNPSPIFDGDCYLDFYQDVKNKKVNPLLHYIKSISKKTKKRKRYLVDPSHPGCDILILSNLNRLDGVTLWRCDFMREFLELRGYTVEVEIIRDPTEDILSKLVNSKMVICSRPQIRGRGADYASYISRFKKHVIADWDDLLLTEFFHVSGVFRSKNISFEQFYIDIIFLEYSRRFFNYFSVSTDNLGQSFDSKHAKRVVLYPNKISHRLVKPYSKDFSNQGFEIIMASGSPTHDLDYSLVYLDILNFMIKHPDVRITFLGSMSLDYSGTSISERCSIISKTSFDKMLEVLKCYDLQIFSLEENEFNKSKSNIKFIEAGSVGTPILAPKAMPEFSNVINHNVNGFLYSRNDFYQRLTEIYNNKSHLESVSYNAYLSVKERHTTKYIDDCGEFLSFVEGLVND